MGVGSPELAEHYIMALVFDGQYGGQARVGFTMLLVVSLQSNASC